MRKLILLAGLLMAGCAKGEAPIFLATELPAIPEHCDTERRPSPHEPKLPDADVTDIGAVRDRTAFKKALRTSNSYRAACFEQLKAVLPSKESAQVKPTS